MTIPDLAITIIMIVLFIGLIASLILWVKGIE